MPKPIIIITEDEIDETSYLMSSAANKVMLEKSLEQAKNGELIELYPKDL